MSELDKELFPALNQVGESADDTENKVAEENVLNERSVDLVVDEDDCDPVAEVAQGGAETENSSTQSPIAVDGQEADGDLNSSEIVEEQHSVQQAPAAFNNRNNFQSSTVYPGATNVNQQTPFVNSSYVAQQQYAYPNQPTPQTKKKSKGKALFAVVACIAVITAFALFVASLIGDGNPNSKLSSADDKTNVPHVSIAESKEEGLSAAEVYQKVYKSSVSVLAYSQSSGELEVLGSGVVCQIDESNKYTYIATCAHVIDDPSYNLKVELWDGSVYTAEVVGYDTTNDIGVVRIRATGLSVAEFASSEEIQPGATVYAIGSPYSSKFAGTFTRGMVSATNRLVTTQANYQISCIQHDAPINNGNSGGALLNAYGQVIGINALKITSAGYEGLGFAVPSKTVLKVINSVIETGVAPKTPILGISYVQATYYSQFLSDLIEENNLPAGAILVAEITNNSSLKNSELKVNDIIIAVDGEDLNLPDLLVQKIQNSSVGDKLVLSVVRIVMNEDNSDYTDLEFFDVTATLVEKTAESDNSEEEDEEDFYNYFGEDSGNYEDFYNYFYDYFYGNGQNGEYEEPKNDKHFTIPGE